VRIEEVDHDGKFTSSQFRPMILQQRSFSPVPPVPR
jgi:hypothetical protein